MGCRASQRHQILQRHLRVSLPQGRVKVVMLASELRECAKDEMWEGVNMAVLSGASNRQVTLTWAEGRC